MSIKAIRDWRLVNSRPLFNILTELNKLRKENKELTEEIKRLNNSGNLR